MDDECFAALFFKWHVSAGYGKFTFINNWCNCIV